METTEQIAPQFGSTELNQNIKSWTGTLNHFKWNTSQIGPNQLRFQKMEDLSRHLNVHTKHEAFTYPYNKHLRLTLCKFDNPHASKI